MILGGPREGLTFGGLSLEWSLKRAARGKGPPLGALRWGLERPAPGETLSGALRAVSGPGL